MYLNNLLLFAQDCRESYKVIDRIRELEFQKINVLFHV